MVRTAFCFVATKRNVALPIHISNLNPRKMMKTIALPKILTVLAVALAPLAALGDVARGTYVGTVLTTHTYYNAATGLPYAMQNYSRPVTVRIRKPLVGPHTRLVEKNPVSVLISPSGNGQAPGDLLLRSAAVPFASTADEFLVRFWRLKNTPNGLTGKLTNSGSTLGINLQTVDGLAVLVPGRPDLGTFNSLFNFYDARFGTAFQTSIDMVQSGDALFVSVTGYASALGSTLIYDSSTIIAQRQ